MVGKVLAQYQISEKLGEGGMGVVWKARDTRLDRFVAPKTLLRKDPERHFQHLANLKTLLDELKEESGGMIGTAVCSTEHGKLLLDPHMHPDTVEYRPCRNLS